MSMTTRHHYRDDLTDDQKNAIRQVECEVEDRLSDQDDASNIVNAALFMFASWVSPMTDDIAFTPWRDVIDFTRELNGHLYDELLLYGRPGNKQPYKALDPTTRVRLTEDITQRIIRRFCPDWIRS